MLKKIIVKKASTNNLKSIDVEIPHRAITVISGISGSGKSSLAFDTLYAEGQRRFVESMSAYTRQFLERMPRPDVESITGILPAVAIQQRTQSKNPRSTVGTLTEIYDYIRLVYGRIGTTYCRKCNQKVQRDNPQTTFQWIKDHWTPGDRVYITFSLPNLNSNITSILQEYLKKGFTRVFIKKSFQIAEIEDFSPTNDLTISDIYIVADRAVLNFDEDNKTRFIDSFETAFTYGNGKISVFNQTLQILKRFSTAFECSDCEIIYKEPEPRLFSFNNPYGACPVCQGFGRTVDISENLVIPDRSKSLRQGALHPFRTNSFTNIMNEILEAAIKSNISIDKPIAEFTTEEWNFLWNGNEHFWGLNSYFKYLEEKSYKVQNRVMLARYRGFTTCKACNGSRIRTSARQVFVGGKNIPEIIKLPLNELLEFIQNLKLTDFEKKVVGQVIDHIKARLRMLIDIGLYYLTLDRLSHTLSGGELQRIQLSNALGSSLVGTLFVLDEPSIGLHPRDTQRLIDILYKLRDAGNTIVIVEHDPEIIQKADFIIDLGPGAGDYGGKIVFAGKYKDLKSANKSITAQYLTGKRSLNLTKKDHQVKGYIKVYKARQHNLKIDYLKIPMGLMVAITGVSGSGKSTLVHEVIAKALYNLTIHNEASTTAYEKVIVDGNFDRVEVVDQNPIGKSSRSTLATYSKVYDLIRELFAQTPLAKQIGLKPGYFSFNVAGGRCEACQGEGYVTIDMQFLPDVQLVCEECKGTRFKKEVQNILYKEKSIVDVLNMTVDQAIEFFSDDSKIVSKLRIYHDLGLGYLKLGQSSTTLSGGESQRIKLASYLDQPDTNEIVFIFDEPTTGLHLDDISKLLNCFNRLVDAGNTIIVIEHNPYVIAFADWVIDLGPEGGNEGGRVVAETTPEDLVKIKNSYTGKALQKFYKELLNQNLKVKQTIVTT